jgi:hypothetical protein
MGKSDLHIINLKEVIGDFRKYDKKVQDGLYDALQEAAVKIQSKQVGILRAKVIRWTGNLASSIDIKKPDKLTLTIGPDTGRAVYAAWIEYGGRGGFKGYRYVRDSIKGVKPKLTAAIKRIIDNP